MEGAVHGRDEVHGGEPGGAVLVLPIDEHGVVLPQRDAVLQERLLLGNPRLQLLPALPALLPMVIGTPHAEVEHNQAYSLAPEAEELGCHEGREDRRPSEQRQRRGRSRRLCGASGSRRSVVVAVQGVLTQGAPDVCLGELRLRGEALAEGPVRRPTRGPLGVREDRAAVLGDALQAHEVELDIEGADQPHVRVQNIELMAGARHTFCQLQVLDGVFRVPDGVQPPRSEVQRRSVAGPAEAEPRPPLHPQRVRGVEHKMHQGHEPRIIANAFEHDVGQAASAHQSEGPCDPIHGSPRVPPHDDVREGDHRGIQAWVAGCGPEQLAEGPPFRSEVFGVASRVVCGEMARQGRQRGRLRRLPDAPALAVHCRRRRPASRPCRAAAGSSAAVAGAAAAGRRSGSKGCRSHADDEDFGATDVGGDLPAGATKDKEVMKRICVSTWQPLLCKRLARRTCLHLVLLLLVQVLLLLLLLALPPQIPRADIAENPYLGLSWVDLDYCIEQGAAWQISHLCSAQL
mmetsp:Transcript_48428/g.156229  ORF Transcript_48428/g.156229 Transcript_48428/m.156229 type:complete len:516 (-) Transcript_48428:1155-2702(-)